MKKLSFTLLFIVISLFSTAQYKHAIGLSFGSPSGISYKTLFKPGRAWDLTLGGLGYYFDFTALYEFEKPINNGFYYYYGPGAHIGSWREERHGRGLFLGVDGILGIDYKPPIPFVFSIDLGPSLNLSGNQWDEDYYWLWWHSRFSVRYTFR